MNHLFSICVPTYKRLKYIKESVGLIPNDIMIYISDNGNFITDEFSQYENVNVSHSDEVIPMFDNFNRAISLADTPWVLLPGDDDVYVTETLNSINNIIKGIPENVSMVIFGHDIIDENDSVSEGWKPGSYATFEKGDYFERIKYGVPARLPSILFNKALLEKEGGFDSAYVFTAGDSFLIQKLALKYKVVTVPSILSLYRVWKGNYTSMENASKNWFDKIQLWCDQLTELLEKENTDGKYDVDHIKRRIWSSNILSGLSSMKDNNKSRSERISFLREVGFPYSVGIVDALRIAKNVIL